MIDLYAAVVGWLGRREKIHRQSNAVGSITLYNARRLSVVGLGIQAPRVDDTNEALVEVNLYLHQARLAYPRDRRLEVGVQHGQRSSGLKTNNLCMQLFWWKAAECVNLTYTQVQPTFSRSFIYACMHASHRPMNIISCTMTFAICHLQFY